MKPALRLTADGQLWRNNLSDESIEEAEALFADCFDTKEIADLFRTAGVDVWECDVANVLARRRDFARGAA